jgi:NADPH-dependent glutamate synthase beta subunit-like oxidoreductase
VSEYGITVRWDKNFLTVLYITLARQRLMRLYGGVRFGGTIDLDDAWKMGFDHVAIAAGAGRPTIIPLKNNLVRGIRKASDFLMGLQLTGAYKRSALANLQVRLPAIVIGGGLTAIDTATELIAYYVIQVEKTATRIDTLIAERGETPVMAMFDEEEREFLAEQRRHAAEVREEREKAKKEGACPTSSPSSTRGAASRSFTASASSTRPRIASTTRRSSSPSKRACATSRTWPRWRPWSTSAAT